MFVSTHAVEDRLIDVTRSYRWVNNGDDTFVRLIVTRIRFVAQRSESRSS